MGTFTEMRSIIFVANDITLLIRPQGGMAMILKNIFLIHVTDLIRCHMPQNPIANSIMGQVMDWCLRKYGNFSCKPEQAGEKTVELLVICDAMTPIWILCNLPLYSR